jgi:hypothetical protein
MLTNAKTIQIFLPDGEPRGIRIAEITTRIVQAIQIPRSQLDRAMERPELDKIGVYYLFGEPDRQDKPFAYVGQTEDLRVRLKKHRADKAKDFWQTAVAIISRTDSFTLAHIRYLEWLSLKQSNEASRYLLDNANDASQPFITEPMKADVLDAFETAGVLLSALGFPLFEPFVGKTVKDNKQPVYYCHGPGAEAQGQLVNDGFVVLKESRARADTVASAGPFLPFKRKLLQDRGDLVPEGNSLKFLKDCLFDSPSGAAAMVLGRTANGWLEWKTSEGKTLHDVERAAAESEQPPTSVD